MILGRRVSTYDLSMKLRPTHPIQLANASEWREEHPTLQIT